MAPVPSLPPHWQSPVASAVACVVCAGFVEAAASVSPLAARPAVAAEISLFSAVILRYAAVATEAGVLVALTLVAGLVLMSRRVRTPEGLLRLALQVTTLGFTFALLLLLTGFLALFVIPHSSEFVR